MNRPSSASRGRHRHHPELGRDVPPLSPGRAGGPEGARSPFGAAEAAAHGLVTEVVKEAPLDRALQLASELSELPPLCDVGRETSRRRDPDSSRDASILIEQLAYGTPSQNKDPRDAADAFDSRRKP
jgi:enoyl-CoA hydratase/carnithine racemase